MTHKQLCQYKALKLEIKMLEDKLQAMAREVVKRKAIPAHIGIYGVTEDEEIVRVRNPQIKRRYDQRLNARVVVRDVM